MKQNPLNLLFAMVLGTLVLTGCSRSDDESPVPSAAQPDEPQSRLKQDPHGGTVITLDPATQAVMDLRVAPLASAEWKPGLDAFGRVLDLAPLAELVAELGRAQMEFDAAHAELERMKVLRQQNNTSEKAFQAAESACQLSQTAVSAIQLRIRNAWGEKLADMTGSMTVPVGGVDCGPGAGSTAGPCAIRFTWRRPVARSGGVFRHNAHGRSADPAPGV
ncbi:MAG: hypothetical protein MUC91_12755, partial [Verrucomicrobia bacterium]|nr:hypothetical protein [Verrucomicrobiota bacterium]